MLPFNLWQIFQQIACYFISCDAHASMANEICAYVDTYRQFGYARNAKWSIFRIDGKYMAIWIYKKFLARRHKRGKTTNPEGNYIQKHVNITQLQRIWFLSASLIYGCHTTKHHIIYIHIYRYLYTKWHHNVMTYAEKIKIVNECMYTRERYEQTKYYVIATMWYLIEI